MSILILVTGGTFDKEYNELEGSLFFRRTHVPEMLRLGRSRLPVRVKKLFMVDSLLMTRAQRDRIAGACLSAAEQNIVVTHGTDTMIETARLLAKKVGDRKTIVLTGAMVPYAFGSSDGLFNLGSALSFAQTLPNGIYVAMNGRYFHWDRVRKNRSRGIFETASPLASFGSISINWRHCASIWLKALFWAATRLSKSCCGDGFG